MYSIETSYHQCDHKVEYRWCRLLEIRFSRKNNNTLSYFVKTAPDYLRRMKNAHFEILKKPHSHVVYMQA